MKVTTSCCGRFHIFDQAAQLERLGALHRLIQTYPRLFTRRWGIPDAKVAPLLAVGVVARAANKLPIAFKARIMPLVHDAFSRCLARHVPPDSDVFIGLSSFCLEAIECARALDIPAVVDHGSLHQRMEWRLMVEEIDRLGLPRAGRLASEWIIDKEDREFRAADKVMVLSEAARRSLVKEGIPADKIFVNPCGVDLDQFAPGAKADDRFRVIFCGAITPRKGVHYLLQAFSELRLPDAELWIVGGAPDEGFRRRLACFDSAAVRYLGVFPQARLASLYAQGSVFVLPSVADGFGMVVTQALACGLPAIVTENVGAADVIREGKNGFVVPIRDVDALKDRIERLYRDPGLRRAMSSEAASGAGRDLSWNAYGDRLVAFLNGIEKSKVAKGA